MILEDLMSDIGPSTVEVLPNELLVDVCQYFTAHELYHAFYGLNRRFRSIIDSISDLHLTITDHTDHRLTGLDSRRVSKLTIDSTKEIHFRRFSQIRSLQWIRPLIAQLGHLSASTSFLLLEHLSVFDMPVTPLIARLQQLIFSNGFPLVRTCKLSRIDISCPWTTSPSLRGLQAMGTYEPLLFQRLLMACPNLTRLDFNLVGLIHTVSSPTLVHVNLKRLYLTGSWSCGSLETLVVMVPALIVISGRWKVREQALIYFQLLSNTFNRQLPFLNRFECDFVFNAQYEDLIRSRATLDRLHPCFTNRLQFTKLNFGRVRIHTQ